MHRLINHAQRNPWGVSPDSFIFWTEYKEGVPMQGHKFVLGLRSALIKCGFTETEAGKYVFHGWRHFYTTYLLGKLERKLLKSQTGHLTDSMLAHYGEHQTEGDRKIIQATAINTFGNLLPDLRAVGE
jgi:integrase